MEQQPEAVLCGKGNIEFITSRIFRWVFLVVLQEVINFNVLEIQTSHHNNIVPPVGHSNPLPTSKICNEMNIIRLWNFPESFYILPHQRESTLGTLRLLRLLWPFPLKCTDCVVYFALRLMQSFGVSASQHPGGCPKWEKGEEREVKHRFHLFTCYPRIPLCLWHPSSSSLSPSPPSFTTLPRSSSYAFPDSI